SERFNSLNFYMTKFLMDNDAMRELNTFPQGEIDTGRLDIRRDGRKSSLNSSCLIIKWWEDRRSAADGRAHQPEIGHRELCEASDAPGPRPTANAVGRRAVPSLPAREGLSGGGGC